MRADWLRSHPANVVIIAPQSRACDVILEIEREGMTFKPVLIEHGGTLSTTLPIRIRIGKAATAGLIVNRSLQTRARRK